MDLKQQISTQNKILKGEFEVLVCGYAQFQEPC